jgi:hypothetical protein
MLKESFLVRGIFGYTKDKIKVYGLYVWNYAFVNIRNFFKNVWTKYVGTAEEIRLQFSSYFGSSTSRN